MATIVEKNLTSGSASLGAPGMVANIERAGGSASNQIAGPVGVGLPDARVRSMAISLGRFKTCNNRPSNINNNHEAHGDGGMPGASSCRG